MELELERQNELIEEKEIGKYVIQQNTLIVLVYVDQYGGLYLDKETVMFLNGKVQDFRFDGETQLYKYSEFEIKELISKYVKEHPEVSLETERRPIKVSSKRHFSFELETKEGLNIDNNYDKGAINDMLNELEKKELNEDISKFSK